MPPVVRLLPLAVFLLCAVACTGGDAPSMDAGSSPECVLSAECSFGFHCRAGRCTSGCTVDRDCPSGEECNADAFRCVASGVPDAGFDAGHDGGSTCDSVCEPDSRRCDGRDLAGCVEDASGCRSWVVLETCERCVEGACAPPPCAAGERRCGRLGVEICNENGVFRLGAECVQGCVDGACSTTVSCEPGVLRCLGLAGGIEQRCSRGGDAWLVERRCESGCVDGACADPCESGLMRCDGAELEVCVDGAWAVRERCANGCSAGACRLDGLVVAGEEVRLSGDVDVAGGVEISSGGRLLVEGALTLRARSIHVDTTSSIVVTPSGVGPEGNAQDGKECASSTSIASGGGGGGSGARGEDSRTVSGGCFPKALGGAGFGSDRDTAVAPGGRGGTGGGASGGAGGRGGGVLRLVAPSVVLEGDVLVEGEHGAEGVRDSGGGGGGAGGGVLLVADSVMVTPDARVSTAGGLGGTGSWLGNGVGGPANGGDGAVGRLKVLANERDLAGDMTGTRTESAPAPFALSSSTHPEEDAVWNDGASIIDLAWESPPGAEARDVLWELSRTSTAWPTIATAERARAPVLALPMPTTAGEWFVFVTSLDGNGQGARASARRRLVVNATPPNVTSASHRAGTFTDESTAVFAWTDPAEGRHWPRYRWQVDRKGRSLPTLPDARETASRGALVEGLADGRWVFHVVALDRAGSPTKAARHFEFGVGPTPGFGTFEATVRSAATGLPIGSASATLNDGLEDATAGSTGVVRFSGVFAGNYELTVTRPGYAPHTLPVQVVAGVTTRHADVLLEAAP